MSQRPSERDEELATVQGQRPGRLPSPAQRAGATTTRNPKGRRSGNLFLSPVRSKRPNLRPLSAALATVPRPMAWARQTARPSARGVVEDLCGFQGPPLSLVVQFVALALLMVPACMKTSPHVGPPSTATSNATTQQDAPDSKLHSADLIDATQQQVVPLPKARRDLIDGIESEVPHLSRPDTYVSSKACASCHPNEHASWHDTYHRTMTQLALPENVLSDFEDTSIQSAGLDYRVFRKGDEFWAELPDPDRMLDMSRGDPTVVPAELPRVRRRVLMATGSHHYQTYWVGHQQLDTVLNTLPLVYLPAEEKWIPREAAFISPPDRPFRMITIWNDHCINCHSTGGNPGLKGPKTLDTSVGELGIACEACHGPGENHVAYHNNRPNNPASDSKATLTHPAKLDHVRSSQICGQCHGVFVRLGAQGMKFAQNGIQFRPGDDLNASRYYVQFPSEDSSARDRELFQRNRDFFRERWWDDGTMLAGGREYSAMQRSPCYVKGEASCLSCHSMHDSDPDDQLIEGMRGNQACIQCHAEAKFTTALATHSHHVADSSGSNCMNCHMPHTSYALFSAIRNHTITSPNIRNSVQHGVPNACNLCHLDKTLDWTQNNLSKWFAQPKLELSEDEKRTSAAVLWTLKGHAAQRVIAAWHYGWKPAQETSANNWMIPVLSQLLRDPYGVVRHVAERSLKSMPGQNGLEYDFLGDTRHQDEVIESVNSHWTPGSAATSRKHADARSVLLDDDGSVLWKELEKLLRGRNDRPVTIKE